MKAMNKNTVVAGFLLSVNLAYSQDMDAYRKLILKADSLYEKADYKNAASAFSQAFKTNDWKGYPDDRYNAACCWALANVPDSAFFNLDRIAKLSDYQNYGHLTSDGDLKSLHHDKRWKPLTELVKKNKEKAEAKLNKPLVATLDSIHEDDQALRMKVQEIEKQQGPKSEEMRKIWKQININDSLNLIKVKAILDKYGWLGADVVGNQGNSTLFLVIQHSDLKTQEHYLPLMREAVKNGKASGSSLALLEDRIEIRSGRKQIYGSQIGMDANNNYYVSPLMDPDHVDKRRASVGLPPLADYVKYWNMTWDVELYKKDLPRLESIQKKY
jgi:hypothetical protein